MSECMLKVIMMDHMWPLIINVKSTLIVYLLIIHNQWHKMLVTGILHELWKWV